MIKSKQSSKGITLIEIIIAVAILAIGIVGVLRAFPLGIHLAKTSQMSTVATQLGQAKIEQEISNNYNDISAVYATEDYGMITNFASYKRVMEINCIEPVSLTTVDCDYDLSNDPYPLKKIKVAVFWRSSLGIGEKNINLISFVAKR